MGTPVPLHYYVIPAVRNPGFLIVTDTWADGRKNDVPIIRGEHATKKGAEGLAAEWNKTQPTMQPTGPVRKK